MFCSLVFGDCRSEYVKLNIIKDHTSGQHINKNVSRNSLSPSILALLIPGFPFFLKMSVKRLHWVMKQAECMCLLISLRMIEISHCGFLEERADCTYEICRSKKHKNIHTCICMWLWCCHDRPIILTHHLLFTNMETKYNDM